MAIRRVEPEQAQELLGSGYTYLDVRTEEEFAAGHVPGAVNVPLLIPSPEGPGLQPNPSFLADVQSLLEPTDQVVTGCLRGGRSLRAAEILEQNGYSDVVDMRGGYDGEVDAAGAVTFPGWTRRGLPTTTG